MAAFGGDFVDAFKIPGAESQKAVDLLQDKFPSQSGDSATLAFEAEAGINDPATRQSIEAILAESAQLPEVVGVVSPYDVPSQISADGTIAYGSVQFDKAAHEVDLEARRRADGPGRAAAIPMHSLLRSGGSVISASEQPEMGTSELIGLAVAIIVLLLTFGSVVAMGLPIITALVGVGIGFMIATISACVP